MAKPKGKNIVVIQDTREQCPLNLAQYGLEVIVAKLIFGDYSIKYPNFLDTFVIERKSLADFTACCGRERERFERELHTLRGFPFSFVVCEFGFRDVFGGDYRSKINPNSVMSSIAKWSGWGVHFLFCDHHEGASYVAAKLIEFTVRDVVDAAVAKCLLKDDGFQAERCQG